MTDLGGIADAIRVRHHELVDTMRRRSTAELLAPSLLPDWSRLTIVCHLRHGAEASRWMTEQTLAGEATAFYPGARAEQRPSTLVPRANESAEEVVESMAVACDALDAVWRGLHERNWIRQIREPSDNTDLGPVSLSQLAVLRLTEVEVHGADLDVGAAPWSDVFVECALPMRLRWLRSRRPRSGIANTSISGSWRFRTDVIDATVRVDDAGQVDVEEGPPTSAVACTFAGSSAEILAALLGRRSLEPLIIEGDSSAAVDFAAAFPPP